MKVMKLLRERSSLKRYLAGHAALLHRCPVCRKEHEVSAVRAEFAYGRQLACGPDCEAERRRRARAGYRGATLRAMGKIRLVTDQQMPAGCRDERDSQRRGALPLVGGAEPKVTLCVTLESVDALRVRREVFQSVGGAVELLKAAPVPHSSKVRLFVSTKASALDALRGAIMRAVPRGEFGRIVGA